MMVELILFVHVAIIGFNVFGLVAVPLGAWLDWRFVRAPLWRLLHLASLAITAIQAALGRACFLTLWQADLTRPKGAVQPMIMQWVNSMIYWPLPLWAFTLIYCLVFGYALALLWLVPLDRQRQG